MTLATDMILYTLWVRRITYQKHTYIVINHMDFQIIDYELVHHWKQTILAS